MLDSSPEELTNIRVHTKDHMETLKIHFHRVPDFYEEMQNLTSVKDTQGGLGNMVLTSKKKDINNKLMNTLQSYDPETRQNFYD